MQTKESTLVKAHLPCDACGSSDARSEYSDGHSFCYACSQYSREGTGEGDLQTTPSAKQAKGLLEVTLPGEGLRKRGLSAETCKRWGYGLSELSGKPVQVAQYRDLKTGAVIAQKCRTASKEFPWVGDAKAAPLFGQWMWDNKGKRIVIVEGEIDAMSVSQLQSHRWPVVSVKNGAQGARKELAKHLDWLSGFDEVVLMFDMDEPGRAAMAECAELFEVGKAKIATLPLKDANEMLVAGRGDEVIKAIWNAREYRPDGVVAAEDLRERVIRKRSAAVSSIDYPFSGLNNTTRGMRPGELVLITAASGTGKSSFVREIAMHLHKQGERVGLVMLEEDAERTLEGLVSIELNVPYEHIREVPEENFLAAFDKLFAEGGFYLFDHFGSSDTDELLNRIRFIAKGLGCRFVILDHVTIAMSGIEVSDERKALDVMMTRLRKLVQETGIGLLVVSHLSRPEGNKSHEDGLQISTKHLRGSHSLVQLADIAIALERNQQAEDEDDRNLTKVRVLKNRFNGKTGPSGFLRYDERTGRITESLFTDESESNEF